MSAEKLVTVLESSSILLASDLGFDINKHGREEYDYMFYLGEFVKTKTHRQFSAFPQMTSLFKESIRNTEIIATRESPKYSDYVNL